MIDLFTGNLILIGTKIKYKFINSNLKRGRENFENVQWELRIKMVGNHWTIFTRFHIREMTTE